MAVDSAGNVYVTGTFAGTASFGGGATNLVATGGTNMFVAKYTSSGAFLWAVSAGFIHWRGGWTVGPRYLAAAPPFFSFGAACGLEKLARTGPIARMPLAQNRARLSCWS